MNPLELERKARHAERQLEAAQKAGDLQQIMAFRLVLEDYDRQLEAWNQQWQREVLAGMEMLPGEMMQ